MDVSAAAEARSRPYYDATPGAELSEQRALLARFEELGEFKRRYVYAGAPAAEVLEETGKQPTYVAWVDVDNGDDRGPEPWSCLAVPEVHGVEGRRCARGDAGAAGEEGAPLLGRE